MSDIVFEEKSAESISANSTLKKKLKVRQKLVQIVEICVNGLIYFFTIILEEI